MRRNNAEENHRAATTRKITSRGTLKMIVSYKKKQQTIYLPYALDS